MLPSLQGKMVEGNDWPVSALGLAPNYEIRVKDILAATQKDYG